jgi:hypothetical protein
VLEASVVRIIDRSSSKDLISMAALLEVAAYSSLKPQRQTDITLVTQCSADRLPNLKVVLQSWTGAVALVLYGKDVRRFTSFCTACEAGENSCR